MDARWHATGVARADGGAEHAEGGSWGGLTIVMASKILLISVNRCAAPDPVFPLGLAHLNAALRQAGHETRWSDCNVNEAALAETLASLQPDFVGISLRNIDDVLIRQRETYYDGLAPLRDTIRQRVNCPIILGGSGFSIFPEKLLALSHFVPLFFFDDVQCDAVDEFGFYLARNVKGPVSARM